MLSMSMNKCASKMSELGLVMFERLGCESPLLHTISFAKSLPCISSVAVRVNR